MKWYKTLVQMVFPSNHENQKLYKYEVPLKRTAELTSMCVSLKPFIDDFLKDIIQSYVNGFGKKSILNGQKAIMQTAALCIIRKEEYHCDLLFQLAFDELMIRSKKLGYYITYAIVEVEETDEHKKEVELYYLKAYPGNFINGNQHNQLWGQLFLEHHIFDEESDFIKIRCNYYLGRNYSEPLPFDDLIQQLCG